MRNKPTLPRLPPCVGKLSVKKMRGHTYVPIGRSNVIALPHPRMAAVDFVGYCQWLALNENKQHVSQH